MFANKFTPLAVTLAVVAMASLTACGGGTQPGSTPASQTAGAPASSAPQATPMANGNGWYIGFEISTDDHFGFGVKKGNTGLQQQIDATLARILGDGTYAALYKQWVGVELSQAQTPAKPDATAPDPASVQLVHPGSLTVCSNAPYAPFEEIDATTNEYEGFDIDLMKQVANDLGVSATFVNTKFDQIESGAAINAGTCDAMASAITITDARKAKFDFSQPYFTVNLGVLTKDPMLTSKEALAGKTVSVQKGTTGEQWCKDNGVQARQFQDLSLQVQAVEAKSVDATVGDMAVLTPYLTSK